MGNLAINKIQNLLLKKWDPIGVGDTLGAENEYAQYAYDIYQIIQHSDSYRELFEYLWELETQHMGLKGNKINTEEFSKMLFSEIRKYQG